eukprot:CAMPEP_0113726336 /NCGR_PEP_ID=MMETSP0038_2-20120614/40368_1 /TAXON_ID=2898 /ORGANISM="Cryptomonas paramecium" /LENGTH=472 /DNA_ID=CAMNT_0000656917 /DNA_START=308 /DNA_END=1724 /DNA_ORIENTATION=+ /assembly_acc=CAM_ASM_000170
MPPEGGSNPPADPRPRHILGLDPEAHAADPEAQAHPTPAMGSRFQTRATPPARAMIIGLEPATAQRLPLPAQPLLHVEPSKPQPLLAAHVDHGIDAGGGHDEEGDGVGLHLFGRPGLRRDRVICRQQGRPTPQLQRPAEGQDKTRYPCRRDVDEGRPANSRHHCDAEQVVRGRFASEEPGRAQAPNQSKGGRGYHRRESPSIPCSNLGSGGAEGGGQRRHWQNNRKDSEQQAEHAHGCFEQVPLLLEPESPRHPAMREADDDGSWDSMARRAPGRTADVADQLPQKASSITRSSMKTPSQVMNCREALRFILPRSSGTRVTLSCGLIMAHDGHPAASVEFEVSRERRQLVSCPVVLVHSVGCVLADGTSRRVPSLPGAPLAATATLPAIVATLGRDSLHQPIAVGRVLGSAPQRRRVDQALQALARRAPSQSGLVGADAGWRLPRRRLARAVPRRLAVAVQAAPQAGAGGGA